LIKFQNKHQLKQPFLLEIMQIIFATLGKKYLFLVKNHTINQNWTN